MLMLATDPVNRTLLREVSKGPTEVGNGQLARILPSGEEVLFISFVVEQWLQKAPGGVLDIDSAVAKLAVETLAASWSSTLIHRLAQRPRSAVELDAEIEGADSAAIAQQLDAMQAVGLAALEGEEDRYAVTDWLRAGIAPLAAGARFEHRYAAPETPSIADLDVEAGFRLTLPLLEMPEQMNGTCRLVVDLPIKGEVVPAGVTVGIERSRVVSISTQLRESADASLKGTPSAWLDAVIGRITGRLLPDGDEALARAIVEGMHDALFGLPVC
jgi:DNA-binding HxlR family transcriptional regulator